MEKFKNKNDDVYYSELQAALRDFDNKLWMIPGLFFGLVTFLLSDNNLNFFLYCLV